MSARPTVSTVPRSLVWATDIDVLPVDRVVERRDRYLVVRSPSNPAHYWGNLLLFDDPPVAGDGSRWERCFELEFRDEPRVQHRTFAWDCIDGELGCPEEEFVSRGYELEKTVGLVGTPDSVRSHQRENREVTVCALDPLPAADRELWHQVLERQVATRGESFEEQSYRDFSRRRLEDLRALFRAGRGAWFVAVDPGGQEVQASCGVVVTGTRGRFQAVDTAEAHRRKGICSRLVVEAAHRTAEKHGTEHFVIAADPDYHALGLYESLGFRRAERVSGVYRRPTTA
ncbi:MAG: GNAT family N-acetyltransferase [Actinomycetota bacterium]|nr:GNAT family N-acetyltransferase [Actinomycetota bacterium]